MGVEYKLLKSYSAGADPGFGKRGGGTLLKKVEEQKKKKKRSQQ